MLLIGVDYHPKLSGDCIFNQKRLVSVVTRS